MKPDSAIAFPVAACLSMSSIEDAIYTCMKQQHSPYLSRSFTLITGDSHMYVWTENIRPLLESSCPLDAVCRIVDSRYGFEEWSLCCTILYQDFTTKTSIVWSPGA